MIETLDMNPAVLKRFAALHRKGRLAHAYLFIGPATIGKGETALAVAKMVNCERGEDGLFCDHCPACVKIKAGAHPDVAVIDNPPGESIKIAQIRDVINAMALRPYFGSQRVVIIRNVENFTHESGNAFLKTLEEPSAGAVLLLTTSVPERLLETIRSRCQAVYFAPLTDKALEGRLSRERALTGSQAHFLAYFAQGCPGAAKHLKVQGILDFKDDVIDGFILRRAGEDYMKATVADKERAKMFLDILASWIRDALLVKAGVDDVRLVHRDRKDVLDSFARRYSFYELGQLNKSVVNMYNLLAENLNIKLPLLIIGEQIWEK